jgi:hypothetical protein
MISEEVAFPANLSLPATTQRTTLLGNSTVKHQSRH